MIRTDHDKALKLLDELAETNGLELVMRRYSDGSGYMLLIQKAGSMRTFDYVSHGTNDLGERVYEKTKEAIAKVVATQLP